MYRLFQIGFELYDWKQQPDWVKVLSVLTVVGLIVKLFKEMVA
jgi:hypothetical protein